MCVRVCVCVFVRACVLKRMERERERESMCVLEIVREYFSTILQAFVVCNKDKTFFDIYMNTGQICMKFEADNLEKYENLLKSRKFSEKCLI